MKKLVVLMLILIFITGFLATPIINAGSLTKNIENNYTTTSNSNSFKKIFGGSNEDYGQSVQQTSDGGYIIAGYTESYGNGDADAWLIKTDRNGNMVWDKTFGGSSRDEVYEVQQTSDGGYILTGWTLSSGEADYWLVKTSSNGNKQWEKTYSRTGADYAYSVQQTNDGGYILTGTSQEEEGYFNLDVWLIKTDSNGNKKWEAVFDETDDEEAYCVKQTNDGGYILAGRQQQESKIDLWLIKTDSNGFMEWEQLIDESTQDQADYIEQTSDGGYIITGLTKKEDSAGDLWILKVGSSGNIRWERIYGDSFIDWGAEIHETIDGGYIVTGIKYPDGSNELSSSVILMKTDSSGSRKWEKNFRLGTSNQGTSVIPTEDGGYILTGYTKINDYNHDLWFIKTDGSGNIDNTNSPSPPTVTGASKGAYNELYEYTFRSIDPDNYELEYYVQWGDGRADEWDGPYNSGDECKISHRYMYQGMYIIKATAKNVKGDISDFSYYEVSMPKTKNMMLSERWFNFLQELFLKITN